MLSATRSSRHIRRSCCLPLAAAVFSALALGGCASNKTSLPVQEARIVAPVDAVIMPPPGGPAILKVVSTTFPNAIRQDIFLATQARTVGENKISVTRFTDKGGDGSDARLRDIPFTQINLTEEALTAWPDSGMAVSPFYVQNDYGPFGYAIGKPSTGDTCIYAWQRIEPTLTPSGGIDRGAITVRLQLCKPGASEQELLDVMYRLRLNTSVFPPNRAPALIGRRSAPIRPIGADGFAEVIPIKASPVPAAPARPAAPAPVAVAPAVIAPPPGAPIVPSPSQGGGSLTGGPTVPRPPASGVVVPPPPGSTP